MTQRFEFWHQAVNAEQRLVWESLHDSLASFWRRHLGVGMPVEFERLSLETFGRLCELELGAGYYTTFTVGATRSKAMLALSGSLAREILELRLGGATDGEREGREGFTPIEEALLEQIASVAIQCIDQVYTSAGLGPVGGAKRVRRLIDAAAFSPTDHLVVCHFTVSDRPGENKILLAVQSTLVNALRPTISLEKQAPTKTVHTTARVVELPVEVDVVLGVWRVPLKELSGLQPGREILLPGPSEVAFWVGKQRLHGLHMTVEERRLVLKVERRISPYGEC